MFLKLVLREQKKQQKGACDQLTRLVVDILQVGGGGVVFGHLL